MKYGSDFSWWNSFNRTWFTAIHHAPSCPALIEIHSSAYLATWLKSGAKTHIFEPLCRASAAKWQSGVRVMLRYEPVTASRLRLYQSADSATSVCSPQVSGDAGGRSQYQS